MKIRSRTKKHKPLFRHLMFWFLLLSLVPMSVTSWINYQQAKQNVLSVTQAKLYQSSESSHQFIQNWFDYRMMDIGVQARAQANIELLSTVKKGWKASDKGLQDYVNSEDWLLRVGKFKTDLINLTQHYDYIYDVFLIDLHGNVLFSVNNEADIGNNLLQGKLSNSKFSQAVFSTLQESTTFFSDIERYGPSKNILSGFLTAPINDADGNISGVFAIQMSLDRLFKRMIHRDDANSSLAHYLVAADGLLRTPIFNDLNTILKQEIKTEQLKLWLSEYKNGLQLARQDELVFEYMGPSGNKVFGIHQQVTINNIDWVLISEIDSEEVFRTTSQMAEAVAIVLILSILLIVAIAYIQIKRITTPLNKLSQASLNVTLGKENQQVDINTNDEIGILADAFNNMLTKQHQTELAINKSNEQLRGALTELSSQQYALDQHAIVAITDKAGTIVFVNDKFCEISGYNHDQLIGANHRLLNSGYHPTTFFQDMYNTISSGLVWHGKICNRNKNGSLYWVETTITPYKDNHGTVQQYIAIRTDITKQKALENQQKIGLKIAAIKLELTNTFASGSKLNEQLSQALLHLFKLPNFNLQHKACLYIFNEKTHRLDLAAKQGDFQQQTLCEEDKLSLLCEHYLNSSSITITPFCHEIACKSEPAHGHYIVPLINLHDESELQNHQLVGAILLFSEESKGLDNEHIQLLTEGATIFTNAILRDQATKLLKKATETAQQNNQLKGEFLASMSHEIRTPMNGVLGMLGLLLNSELNADQKHKATLAKSSAESLLVLINDILDFSKVEAGKMELDVIDFNLREMLGELSESMALKAQAKGVEIILDVTGIDYSMVKGDSGRLRQIVTNLISNAIKFTEQGEIKVVVEVSAKENDTLLLQCHVIDSGIGIPEAKVSALFDTFTQVDASTTRKYGGTGLGLAICKKLVQLMDGNIEAISELGKGSTFSFSAKIEKSQQSQRVLPHVDISKLNLLIVDDNSTNLAVLRGQLEYWGAHVVEAESGQQALELCIQRLACGEKIFDVALLDMQMPEMDGAELGRKIRSDVRFNDMKLVMMTSIASQNETQFFADLGFSAYFPKPATTSDLFQALSVVADNGETLNHAVPLVTHDYLASLIQKTDTQSNTTLINQEMDKSAVRILLVEDNKVNQLVALGILEAFGFKADIAEDGQQAITKLTNNDSQHPYQLIYMDCQMPVMDGYQTTKKIRAGKAGAQYKAIPIIAMTANAMEGDREKCLRAGMNDYIGKPIEPKILEDKLYQWLSFEKGSKTDEGNVISRELNETINSSLCIWDQESALQRLVNKKSLLISLIKTFIEEMPIKIEQLSFAIQSGNNKEVAQFAHTIKGAAANLSAMKLAELCLELEKVAKLEGGGASAYQGLEKDLERYYTELIKEFNLYLDNVVLSNNTESRLSAQDAILFLTQLKQRLSDNDYIESDELTTLLDSFFSERINTQFDELQQMITLFDLEGALRLSEIIIIQLQKINEGNS